MGPKPLKPFVVIIFDSDLKNCFRPTEQDTSLDALVSVIERQKQIGLQINQELDYHIELLEDTEDRVDNTTNRLGAASKRLEVVRKTVSSNWGMCTTVCLVVALLVVLVVVKILR